MKCKDCGKRTADFYCYLNQRWVAPEWNGCPDTWIVTNYEKKLRFICKANTFDEAIAKARYINPGFSAAHIANEDDRFNEPDFKTIKAEE